MPSLRPAIKPFALIVLDGWGCRASKEHNAIAEARKPFFDELWNTYPHATLTASEESVGLPHGVIGNSEVGHMTIGAGRVIDTDLVRISKSMQEGGFEKNPAFHALFVHCLKNRSTLHIVGLVSPGGIHSHSEHLYGFLNAAGKAGLTDIAIHVVTDGRDTPPKSGAEYVAKLEQMLEKLGVGRIATIVGRYFTMDRDKNWDRLARAEAAMFRGEGHIAEGKSASAYLRERYKAEEIDELLEPTIFPGTAGPSVVRAHDGVFFFNFRADRARQFSVRLLEHSGVEDTCFVTMTEYGKDKPLVALVAYPPVKIQTTLAAELSRAGLTQAHVAETEKYAHATYFLNGGREAPYPGEEHVLVDSRKDVKTHDQAPEMRAHEITDAAIERIKNGVDFVFLNFANADMVGHTANEPAIIKAVETVDRELKRLVEAIKEAGGVAFITADHGNAEMNVDPETGEKHTAHTTNLVPAILTLNDGVLVNGTLADITPTILSLLGLPKPQEMTGKNLYTPAS